MADTIRVQVADHVATVAITGKTMPPAFFDELGAAFTELATDDALRAVVLYADTPVFSYGLDLRAAFTDMGELFSGGTAATRTRLIARIRGLQASIDAVETCPVPVIAAVHNWCIGGGVDLISACDIRLAAADSKFSVRETRIAIVADLGSLQRLPRIIGHGHTRELAFTGKDIDAEHAQRIGLVNHVYADRAATVAAAHEMARQIAANAPLTVRGVKQVLAYGEDKSVAAGLEYVAAWNAAFLASEDLTEAAAAFMSKREPQFKGK